jgi:A/G-specific adenine glycosylase
VKRGRGGIGPEDGDGAPESRGVPLPESIPQPDWRRLRHLLLAWYGRAKRDLPWRKTKDPYRIWVSEIMLQQTRVASVLPYYARFLRRFPDFRALAAAPEPELLALWAGLGYYSRARNMQRAARQMAGRGGFPRDYDGIRSLPGVGDYTAAAIASIAFGLPHAAVDGNVLRVLARLTADAGSLQNAATKRRLTGIAESLLDRRKPGDFNQALMELGATVCLPRQPQCLVCPWRDHCEARRQGRERELPFRSPRQEAVQLHRTLLVVERQGRLLLWRRSADSSRLAGFWELPEAEQLPKARVVRALGEFRHSITRHNYHFSVARARVESVPPGFSWVAVEDLGILPLSTTTRKALGLSKVLIL